ncbi:hypothetical protein IJG22_02390 [Candidatus Saccharibacteria bacterium]|nr:hypothetical protein [Candidatus Saccharibacteria bacterium]
MDPNQNTNMQNATSAPTSTGASNASSTSLNMSDKSVESSKPGSDVVFRDKPKKSHGMLYGMILLAILAAGGIGFGAWAMMDGNGQMEQLNDQISVLKKQNSELQEQVSNNTEESNVRKACDGTYYGELKEERDGAVFDLKYTYALNEDGTFTADYGGASRRSGVYTINGNTISLTGNREIGGPEDIVPAYVTEDAIVADDCSYIKLESMNGTYGFELKKQ